MATDKQIKQKAQKETEAQRRRMAAVFAVPKSEIEPLEDQWRKEHANRKAGRKKRSA
jgi:hypothetical protein